MIKYTPLLIAHRNIRSDKVTFMPSKKTKTQHAYERIRKFLLMGRLPVGKRASLRSLASELKMSVIPVLEAVHRLEQEGLITIQPQSGIYIHKLSPAKKLQMNILRQALEMQAARLIAIAGNTKKTQALRKCSVRIQSLLEQGKSDLAAYADWNFHVKLVAAANCRMLTEQYDRIAAIVVLRSMDDGLIWPIRNHLHLDIVNSLDSGNPEHAADVVRKHVNAEAGYLP